MKSICTKLGYTVTAVSDGAEALEEYRKRPTSIIISDWIMPLVDGLSLCERIRKMPIHDMRPFFFLVTGRRKTLSDYAQARDQGVDDFIYKPLDFHVFRNQLKVAERVLHSMAA